MEKVNAKIRILVNDDYDNFKAWMIMIANEHPEIELIDTIRSCDQLIMAIEKTQPDVVITSLQDSHSNNVLITKKITSTYPHIPVLAVCMLYHFPKVLDLIIAGAKGCIPLNAPDWELIQAIKTVSKFEEYTSYQIRSTVVLAIGRNQLDRLRHKGVPLLTDDDRLFLSLLCEQNSMKEIADKMKTTLRSVEHRKENLYQTLQQTNVIGLAMFAVISGIYDPFEFRQRTA